MTDEESVMPLYGFVQGDSMGVVVLARPQESVRELAKKLVEASAVRIRPSGEGRIESAGRLLDPDSTLRKEGIGVLDRVDLVWR